MRSSFGRKSRGRRRGFTLAEVIVSVVILAVAAAVAVPYLAAQNRRADAESTRDILFSLSVSLSNPHTCTVVVAPPCPALPAVTRSIGYQGFMQHVSSKFPQQLHQLTTKIALTDRSCNGNVYVAADTVAWNPIGAAPGAAAKFAPYSGLPIVSGNGVFTPLGWVHDSVLKSTTGTPSIAGWVELHIDSLSVDDVQELDQVIDGSVSGTTGLLRFAASGSYQLARFLISAPVNGATTKGC
jgi:prepilin-type N-terminal cleavage/methylation domain-containing protein